MDYLILEEHRLVTSFLDNTPDRIWVGQVVTNGADQFRFLCLYGSWDQNFTQVSTARKTFWDAKYLLLDRSKALRQAGWAEKVDYTTALPKVASLHEQQQDCLMVSSLNTQECPTPPDPGMPVVLVNCSRMHRHPQHPPDGNRVWCGRVVAEHGKYRVETYEGLHGERLAGGMDGEPMDRFTDAEQRLGELSDEYKKKQYEYRWNLKDRRIGEFPRNPIPTPDPMHPFPSDILADNRRATAWFV